MQSEEAIKPETEVDQTAPKKELSEEEMERVKR